MLAPVTHILPLTTIRRERLLPIPGRVMVRTGQKVKPLDVVAEANLAPEHILLQVARGLGVSAEEADRLIERQAGDEVMEGDVIASRGGLARRVVRSPVSGRVVMVGDGLVLLEVESRPYQVLAGLPGNVTQVIPDRGAVIETTGALIQGVWGNGRLDFGLMHVVMETPVSTLTPDQLDVRMRGSIVLAGHCDHAEALEAAAEMALRGLILSSLRARLLPLAARQRFPVVVVEGFGQRPLQEATFQLLSTNDNREVVVNAERFDRLAGRQPEIVIPLPAPPTTGVPQDVVDLAPGVKVRIISGPQAGALGTVAALRSGAVAFPSGLRAQAARVNLTGNKNVMVPVANLEVIA